MNIDVVEFIENACECQLMEYQKEFVRSIEKRYKEHSRLWLKESDICRAAKILHNYEDEKMNRLCEELHIHSRRSDILEDVLIE